MDYLQLDFPELFLDGSPIKEDFAIFQEGIIDGSLKVPLLKPDPEHELGFSFGHASIVSTDETGSILQERDRNYTLVFPFIRLVHLLG